VRLLALILIFAAVLSAGESIVNSFEGEIVWAGGKPHDLVVELLQQGRVCERVFVAADGRFVFRNLTAGQYELRVLSRRGETIKQDFISIHEPSTPHVVRLPPIPSGHRSGGVVSVKALARAVPKTARKAYISGTKAVEKGDFGAAFAHLRRAVELYPDYVEAWNNLGVRYMHAGDINAAVEAFQTAVKVDADAALVQANLGIALVRLKRFDEAERAARHALQVDPSLVQATYVVGITAAVRGECRPETIQDLQTAAQRFPRAHLAAAQMLVCAGRREAAADEIRSWLRVAKADERPVAESFLRQLTHRSP
jgi:Flp pilus assembly protein TadD